jgi:hypothetical protein
MTLPNFLIIGAQRAGSTYLHLLRDKHDCIFVPSRRKEIHYFDRYFARGRHGTRAFSRVAKRRLGSKQLAKQPPLEELPTHGARRECPINPDRSNAAADTRLPGLAMLDATIERCEAARHRYLARLSAPNLRTFTLHRNQRLLNVIEMRLAHLRAHREAWSQERSSTLRTGSPSRRSPRRCD